jgi:threonine dehydratase
MLPPQAIAAAERRVRAYVRETPVELSHGMSQRSGAAVYLKLENLQVTGSFKARGALHKLLSLDAEERARGVIAASSGNHGLALAHGALALGCQARVFVPRGASPAKVAAMRLRGAAVEEHGDDCLEAEAAARRAAASERMVYISPYNDLEVVAGQGTVAVELGRQLRELDAVYVALGGGGLIAGIATYLKTRWPRVRVIACSPERSPAMHECLMQGRIVPVACAPTLSDGTAGGVEEGAVTFELCRALVDESLLVSEDEIRRAMATFIAEEHMLCEGAAGVALAGFARHAAARPGGAEGERVAIVICGANVDTATLAGVLA